MKISVCRIKVQKCCEYSDQSFQKPKYTSWNLPSGSGCEPRELTRKGREGLPSNEGTSTLSSEETVTSGCDSEDRN